MVLALCLELCGTPTCRFIAELERGKGTPTRTGLEGPDSGSSCPEAAFGIVVNVSYGGGSSFPGGFDGSTSHSDEPSAEST